MHITFKTVEGFLYIGSRGKSGLKQSFIIPPKSKEVFFLRALGGNVDREMAFNITGLIAEKFSGKTVTPKAISDLNEYILNEKEEGDLLGPLGEEVGLFNPDGSRVEEEAKEI